VQELVAVSYSLLLGSDRLLRECLFGSQFLSFPSLGLQPAPIKFSLSIFILALLFRTRFSCQRLVLHELIFGLSAESLALPSLIPLDPDLSPVHVSLVRWSGWLPILFVCVDPVWILCPIAFFSSRAKDIVLHPRFAARGFPAHPTRRGLQSSLVLFPVEHMSCSLGSSKGSILVQISCGFWCGLLQDLVPVYS
jgi:hypothetical protein